MLDAARVRDIDELIEAESPESFAPVDIRPFVGRAPEALVEIWNRVGVAAWDGGSYHTIEPMLLKSVVNLAFASSSIDCEAAIPYLLSPFGRITCWHPKFGLITIDPLLGRNIITKDPNARKQNFSGDIEILSGFPVLDPDESNFGLYRAAVKKLGTLNKNQIFAFVPSLAFGGQAKLKFVEKQVADVHLDMLAQSSNFETFYIEGDSRGSKLVRID